MNQSTVSAADESFHLALESDTDHEPMDGVARELNTDNRDIDAVETHESEAAGSDTSDDVINTSQSAGEYRRFSPILIKI